MIGKKNNSLVLGKMLIAGSVIFCLLAGCSSPAKKQHEDKNRRINELQNVGSAANDGKETYTTKPAADSTNTDTTGVH